MLYDQLFSRYMVAENRKCAKWPQTELEHLRAKSTLYTLNTYLRSRNFRPFNSTINRFRDTWRKSEIHGMTFTWRLTVKSTLYTLNIYLWGPEFGPFRSMISSFRDTCTRLRNSEMHRVTPNWTWSHNSQKYSIYRYIKHLPQRPRFWSLSLYH